MIKKVVNELKTTIEDMAYTFPDSVGDTVESERAKEMLKTVNKIDKLYSVYEFNPYGKIGSRWEELACSINPETCKDIAESLARSHEGQIDLRYDYKDGKYEIRADYHSYPVKPVKPNWEV